MAVMAIQIFAFPALRFTPDVMKELSSCRQRRRIVRTDRTGTAAAPQAVADVRERRG
jgi:hypothetical protein